MGPKSSGVGDPRMGSQTANWQARIGKEGPLHIMRRKETREESLFISDVGFDNYGCAYRV